MVWFDFFSALNFADGHFCESCKYLGQHTFLTGCEVLDNYVGYAGVFRQILQKLSYCVKAACGRAYASNWEGFFCLVVKVSFFFLLFEPWLFSGKSRPSWRCKCFLLLESGNKVCGILTNFQNSWTYQRIHQLISPPHIGHFAGNSFWIFVSVNLHIKQK